MRAFFSNIFFKRYFREYFEINNVCRNLAEKRPQHATICCEQVSDPWFSKPWEKGTSNKRTYTGKSPSFVVNPIFPGQCHQNGGFSMAMLVYRSVQSEEWWLFWVGDHFGLLRFFQWKRLVCEQENTLHESISKIDSKFGVFQICFKFGSPNPKLKWHILRASCTRPRNFLDRLVSTPSPQTLLPVPVESPGDCFICFCWPCLSSTGHLLMHSFLPYGLLIISTMRWHRYLSG